MAGDPGRTIRILAALALAVVAAGCGFVYSLRPPYTDSDVAFDAGLLGTWVVWNFSDPSAAPDEGGTWVFRKGEDGGYRLTMIGMIEKNDTITVAARLIRLGPDLFLDVTPDPAVMKEHGFLVLPLHMTLKADLQRDALVLSTLDYDWLGRRLTRGEVTLDYLTFGSYIVLTGTTAELREFFLRSARDPEAFIGPIVLVRKE